MSDDVTRLRIETAADGTIMLEGELDSFSAQLLRDQLAASPSDVELTIDLQGVAFVDSSGLRALVEGHRNLEAAGGRLVVRCPSASVQRLLEISGLLEHLHVTSS